MELAAVFIIGFVLWMGALIYHIRRKDCSDTDRVLWAVILCTLNILGVVLYFFLGPRSPEDRVLTEQELIDKFNRGG